jgi:hypothetical protein
LFFIFIKILFLHHFTHEDPHPILFELDRFGVLHCHLFACEELLYLRLYHVTEKFVCWSVVWVTADDGVTVLPDCTRGLDIAHQDGEHGLEAGLCKLWVWQDHKGVLTQRCIEVIQSMLSVVLSG